MGFCKCICASLSLYLYVSLGCLHGVRLDPISCCQPALAAQMVRHLTPCGIRLASVFVYNFACFCICNSYICISEKSDPISCSSGCSDGRTPHTLRHHGVRSASEFVYNFLGPRGPLVLPLVNPYVRTQWKSGHLYIQAYMPHESSGDSSNQPIGHMGFPSRLPRDLKILRPWDLDTLGPWDIET